jgi:hypothetical protein
MMMYASRLTPGRAGSTFVGRLADLIVDESALYRFVDVDDADAQTAGTWPTTNGVAQPPVRSSAPSPSAVNAATTTATGEGACATQNGGR